ncbi:MAG: hypothetical protein ACNS62_14410 [Candidatus Cyclobacteriaceae bacterium M3_2C_046]
MDYVFYFLMALVIYLIYYLFIRGEKPWGNLWVLLMVLFTGAWVASFWVHPLGPGLEGGSWITLFTNAIIIVILLILIISTIIKDHVPKQSKSKAKFSPDQPKTVLYVILGAILLLLFSVHIIVFFS